jgi:hypothetical protein
MTNTCNVISEYAAEKVKDENMKALVSKEKAAKEGNEEGWKHGRPNVFR